MWKNVQVVAAEMLLESLTAITMRFSIAPVPLGMSMAIRIQRRDSRS